MENSERQSEKFSWLTNRTFLAWYGALFAVAVIILMLLINMATQMEDLEEKLQFTPPSEEKFKGSEIPAESVVAGQTVYVPIYSHIYHKGGKPFLLEATLSIRNTDPGQSITVNAVRYYDSQGKMLKNYLTRPLRLAPLATSNFLLKQSEISGGSGANFIVEWVSEREVNKPVIEAVMVGIEGEVSISFVRSGIAITRQPIDQ